MQTSSQTVPYLENDSKPEQDRGRSATDSKCLPDTTVQSFATSTVAAPGPSIPLTAEPSAPLTVGPSIPLSVGSSVSTATMPSAQSAQIPMMMRQNSATAAECTSPATQSAKKISRFQVNPVTEGTNFVESMSHPNLVAAAEASRMNIGQQSFSQSAVSESLSAPSLNEIQEAIATGQQHHQQQSSKISLFFK